MPIFSAKEKLPKFCNGSSCNSYNTCAKDNTKYCCIVQELDKLKKTINSPKTSTDPIFKPIMFFSQDKRPQETQFLETIKDTKKFYLMARTGVTFLSRYSQRIKMAIDSGCDCKFIILNQDSQAIKYGRHEASIDQENVKLSYTYLKDLKLHREDKVKIHILDYYPTFDFEYFEKTDGRKIIVVQTHFLLSHLGPDRPMFMLSSDDFWYQTFLDEFDYAWEKSQEWGKEKRIVIDGAPGSGKTTLLAGISQRDESKKKFTCFKDASYPIFDELIFSTIDDMRTKGISDPSDNWDMFFELAVDRAIYLYKKSIPDLINFYDRGIFYLEIMAERYGYKMPKKYYDFCNSNRYDDPVFVLHPILDIDMTKPHKTDNTQKIYTIDDRLSQHKKIVELYKKHDYNVIEIPVLNSNSKDNVELRLAKIKKELGI